MEIFSSEPVSFGRRRDAGDDTRGRAAVSRVPRQRGLAMCSPEVSLLIRLPGQSTAGGAIGQRTSITHKNALPPIFGLEP